MYAEKLKYLRKQFGFTIDEFAKQFDMLSRTYASYERGERNPSFNVMNILCDKFNVNMNWFIANKGDAFIAPQYEDIKAEILAEVDKVLVKYGVKNL